MRILAGDIGGTKTALALYESTPAGHRTVRASVYASGAHPSLTALLREFLQGETSALAAAAFGVAGPVQHGACVATNLPWTISAAELGETLGTRVGLVNDFHATALGVRELVPEQLCVLQQGELDPTAPYAVLGAGTGLGEAIGVPEPNGGVRVLAGEGGHADFAPRNALEIRLLEFLLARHKRVSYERVVSGIGLRPLYEFVVHEGFAPADPITTARFESESPGAVIGERGLSRVDPAARKTLEIFVSIYAGEAGNLALRVLPGGGLYVAGGIAHKLLPLFTDGAFMASFSAKGRLSSRLSTIPVAVVRAPDVGLLGARACAAVLSKAG